MTDKGLKILLIEDSVSDAALLQENLSLSGARDISISVVQSLHEAESHLKNNHIDAIYQTLNLFRTLEVKGFIPQLKLLHNSAIYLSTAAYHQVIHFRNS